MTFELVSAFLGLLFGIALLLFSSGKAGEHSINLAASLGASPFIIGVLLVSIGTDLPEIANSITSSGLGHGNINVGDSLGSILAQITLAIGLTSLVGGELKSDRRVIVITGASGVLAIIFFVSITEKGYISRLDGVFLMSSWLIFMLISRYVTQCCGELHACRLREKTLSKRRQENSVSKKREEPRKKPLYDLTVTILGLIGVAVGAHFSVRSVIAISSFFQIDEYFISFFILGLGTSLPEIVLDLWAARRKHFDLLIGDVIGSCIVDATLSVGIGPAIFPIGIEGAVARTTGIYTILAFLLVLLLVTSRMKLDKKTGVVSITLYILSLAAFYWT